MEEGEKQLTMPSPLLQAHSLSLAQQVSWGEVSEECGCFQLKEGLNIRLACIIYCLKN